MSSHEHNAEVLLNRIRSCGQLEENKELIFRFYREWIARGSKVGTMVNHLKVLCRLAIWTNKRFEKLTKDDLIEFFTTMKPAKIIFPTRKKIYEHEVKEFSPQTMVRMKANVKVFWKWMFQGNKKAERDERGVPIAVSWMKTGYRNVKSKQPKDILTRDEVMQMIKVATSPRTKALVAVLFESGMRAGELLGMRRNEIKFYEDYCEFICDGKTGKRPVVLIKSYPFLRQWLEVIEGRIKEIPKEYRDRVWLNVQTNGYRGATPLTNDALSEILKYTGRKAGIEKRIWTHGFRHSSATDFAKQGYNETEMRLKYGWTATSDIPANYTHYKHDELKNKILMKSGKGIEDTQFDGNMLQTRDCPFCSVENPADAEYCFKCGKPMTTQKIKESEKQSQALETMQALISELKRLEDKGFDIQQFNSFMQDWSKNKEKKAVY